MHRGGSVEIGGGYPHLACSGDGIVTQKGSRWSSRRFEAEISSIVTLLWPSVYNEN